MDGKKVEGKTDNGKGRNSSSPGVVNDILPSPAFVIKKFEEAEKSVSPRKGAGPSSPSSASSPTKQDKQSKPKVRGLTCSYPNRQLSFILAFRTMTKHALFA